MITLLIILIILFTLISLQIFYITKKIPHIIEETVKRIGIKQKLDNEMLKQEIERAMIIIENDDTLKSYEKMNIGNDKQLLYLLFGYVLNRK